jgi:SGNH domain (fused to AT3 domains)
VIRDNPSVSLDTNACVERALAARRPAGRACALERRTSLDPDPAATAARRLGSPRVRVLDLTRFFCGARQCYPVIGGVLVYKDTTHLTGLYARTLAPYLGRAVDAVIPVGGRPGAPGTGRG